MKEKRGLEKIGLPRTPTSSGLPQRTMYTCGRAETLSKTVYGHTPTSTVTKDAASYGGTRQTHVIGKRD